MKVAVERSATWPFSARIQPFCGDDDGQGLALDHRLGELGHDVGRRLEAGAPAAELGLGAELLLHVADLDRDDLPLPPLAAEQPLDRRLLLGQVVLLLAQRHLLETAQASQARVEDIDDLQLAEAEAGLQRLLRIVLLADDADHLVEIEEDDDHPGEQLEPLVDRREAMARAAHQHDPAVVEPLLQRLA